MSLWRLAALYAAFGAVATAANLAAQWAARTTLGLADDGVGLGYWFALGFGTGVGLVIKYGLDKRWIFDDRSTGVAAHGKRFGLYTAMGVATTVVFWGMQTLFFIVGGTEASLYIGGALGLAIGYVVKYRLDKAYVFTAGAAEA
ncbi:MAG: GtrA family protein [Pseudomonadota bacterium]